MLLGLLGALIVVKIDQGAHLPAQWRYSPSTATTVLSAIIGAMAALTGFVVTVTVLVVQMATGTFSARSMRLWYRDPVLKGTLALLAGTLVFSFSLLRRVETNFVPDIGVTVAGVLVAAALVLFLLFFDRFVHDCDRSPWPSSPPADAASLRDDVARLADADDIFIAPAEGVDGQPALAIRSDRPGAIQAINSPGGEWARKHDCLAVIKHAIGDFVQVGDPLIEVYGDPGDAAEAERTLNGLVALGVERTIEQDPAFAMRIMVDVANKALSTAINDPTTAVQVLNYIGDSLRLIGATDLAERSRRPGAEAVGMVIPTDVGRTPRSGRHRDPRVRQELDPSDAPNAGYLSGRPARRARRAATVNDTSRSACTARRARAVGAADVLDADDGRRWRVAPARWPWWRLVRWLIRVEPPGRRRRGWCRGRRPSAGRSARRTSSARRADGPPGARRHGPVGPQRDVRLLEREPHAADQVERRPGTRCGSCTRPARSSTASSSATTCSVPSSRGVGAPHDLRAGAPVADGDGALHVLAHAGVVRDDDDRGAQLAVDGPQALQDVVRRGGVELAGGLVGEQDLRGVGQGDGDGDALLLAAGHLPGPAVGAVADAEHLEQLGGPAVALLAADPGEREREGRRSPWR